MINNSRRVDVFLDDGLPTPDYRQLAADSVFEQTMAAAGEHLNIQVQGNRSVNIEIYSVHRATDCHVQAQAVVTRIP